MPEHVHKNLQLMRTVNTETTRLSKPLRFATKVVEKCICPAAQTGSLIQTEQDGLTMKSVEHCTECPI